MKRRHATWPRTTCLLALFALALALALPVHAQTSWSKSSSEPDSLVTVHLTDDSIVHGALVSLDNDYVVVRSATLGKLKIPRSAVRSIEFEGEVAERTRGEIWKSQDPDYNSVMLGPTPETLPKNSGYFRNFELFILNFGFAVIDDLNLSFGMLFPISTEVQMFSLGLKYRFLSREKFPVGLAIAGNATIVSDETFGTLSGIVGVGDRRRSLNVSIHQPFVENTSDEPVFFVASGDLQFSGSGKLLAEYGNSARAIFRDEDFAGFINIGFRIFGEKSSFSLTGFRPLEVDGDGFIAFPVAMYSRMW